MKKCIISIVCLLVCLAAIGQVTNEGIPASFDENFKNILKKSLAEVEMPAFDIERIRAEDAINDNISGKLYRFGYEFKVDLDLKKYGTKDVLLNGDHIYRLKITSKKAKSLNFVFSTYKVPTGGTIYLYNEDKTDVLGAYTNVFNRSDEMLGTWMVEGQSVIIEYREPKNVIGQGKLQLGRVVHGYRSITNTEVLGKALNDSGDCNQDVDCPVGSDFDPLKERLKKSIGFIILNGFVCSGSLINNTNDDKAPYFLTANHCDATPFSTWAFRFNWISPNPSCATTTSSIDTTINQTTSGATLLASNSESDFRLLRLDGGLDESWDLEWAGWDRSETAPGFVVGIHHPSGDIMKICRENDSPTQQVIDFNGNTSAEMWNIADWDVGVTEQGSSGSPLFDPMGRIIGQLTGGQAACNGTSDNDQFDVYGRFGVSWDFGDDDTTRLSDWLDPENTGVTKLNMLSQGNDLPMDDEDPIEELVLFPNPTEGMLMISDDGESVLRYHVFNVFGKNVLEGQIDDVREIDLSSFSSGMYFVYVENISNGGIFTKKIIVR